MPKKGLPSRGRTGKGGGMGNKLPSKKKLRVVPPGFPAPVGGPKPIGKKKTTRRTGVSWAGKRQG